ncbi:MAG: acetyl-CoA carboxylase biotin carboxyl carrier protein subunit [Alphaproteobacteria bacterium]|jgi:acetyl-CoA carboxylase biotin carboxyl carrier protein|nr:acetyl-CoA carboxylase biotin carboxyl carrier protein subunit [Alphaproteobacteria bacterium]
MAKAVKLKVDREVIQELTDLLEELGLTEIEVSEGGKSVRVARLPTGAASPSMASQAPEVADATAADQPPAGVVGAVHSPMVGTVYRAAQPGDPPFVNVGDEVTEGQTLMIVEAMKVMNPIPAPHGGRVRDILVEDSQPVEFGDVLLIVE